MFYKEFLLFILSTVYKKDLFRCGNTVITLYCWRVTEFIGSPQHEFRLLKILQKWKIIYQNGAQLFTKSSELI